MTQKVSKLTSRATHSPRKKHSPSTARAPSRKRPPTKHEASLAAYIAAKRHLIFDERQAEYGEPYVPKPIRQIASETGMSYPTARHWLKKNHNAERRRWWPSFDELCEDAGIDLEAASRRAKANPADLPEFDPDVDGLAY